MERCPPYNIPRALAAQHGAGELGKETLDQVELDGTNFLVVDNHPDGRCATPLKQLETLISNYHYVPISSPTGTGVRDVVFAEPDSPFALNLARKFQVPPRISRWRVLGLRKAQAKKGRPSRVPNRSP